MRSKPTLYFASILLIALLSSALRADDVLPKDEIDRLVKPIVDGKWAMGFVVALVNAHDRQVIGYGTKSDTDSARPDGKTVYEIGSVTKTFTATLLADEVARGQMSLDDPVQKYLPAEVKLPTGKEGKPITLLHLVTHSSGLRRMPVNFAPADPGNPYADYTLKQMYEDLQVEKRLHEPGEEALYSNLGMGLLGNMLAAHANKSYEALLLDRICVPLKMQSTRIVLDDAMRQDLAPPFDGDGGHLKNWDLGAFAGAGGIRSTADDMLLYVSAELGLTKTDLSAAMTLTQKRQREFDAGNDIALNWFIDKKAGYHWHNGQTGGYHSFVAFDTDKHAGVVVLCNSAGNIPDLIGSRLIKRLLGETVEPPRLPVPMAVDEKILESYVGEYKLGLVSWFTIKKYGDHLTAKLTGQDAFGIYPLSSTEFFYKVVNARITFEADKDGKVTGMVLHQNGKDLKAEKK
jgi:CubicO group peptidase (beta-lactamase class C family)